MGNLAEDIHELHSGDLKQIVTMKAALTPVELTRLINFMIEQRVDISIGVDPVEI